MTKFFEVTLSDNTNELFNISSIHRVKIKDDIATLTVGCEKVDVMTHSVMAAFHAGEIPVMIPQIVEPATVGE